MKPKILIMGTGPVIRIDDDVLTLGTLAVEPTNPTHKPGDQFSVQIRGAWNYTMSFGIALYDGKAIVISPLFKVDLDPEDCGETGVRIIVDDPPRYKTECVSLSDVSKERDIVIWTPDDEKRILKNHPDIYRALSAVKEAMTDPSKDSSALISVACSWVGENKK